MKRRLWASAVGWPLFLYGCAFMAGWLLRYPFWEGISPTGTLMVFPTAACFALSGIALAAPISFPRNAEKIQIAIGCILIVIALLVLSQSALSIDLGLDLTHIHEWYQDNNPHPGRMAPNTAIAFLIAGAALSLGASNKRIGPIFHALPAAVTTLGLIGLAGYTLLFDLAYTWYELPRMAITTAMGIILLGVALTLGHEDAPRLPGRTEDPDSRINASADALVYAFFGVALTILGAAVFVSFGSIKALSERAAWVEHTGEVRAEFEMFSALDNSGYSAWKTYLATHDQNSFNEVRATIEKMGDHMKRLQLLVADNPTQMERLEAMWLLMRKNSDLLGIGSARIALQPQGMSRDTLLQANRQQFESIAAAFRDEEVSLLRQRQHESQQSIGITIIVILVGNTIGFTILLYAAWLLKRQNELRDKLSAALQDNANFLDSLVEHIPNMVFVKDAKHLRFVRFNRAGEILLGMSRKDLIGKNDYDLFPREEAGFFIEKDRATLAGGDILDIAEEALPTRDKGVRVLHTMKIPIADAMGKPLYLLGISEDITERKQAEQKIAALNASLKARASELEVSNHELESFTYSVSHDLRAPLRAINGYALMLQEDYHDKLDHGGQRYISQIRGYSNQMGELIDDLLRLSRFSRQAMRQVDVNMNELIQDVLKTEVGSEHAPRVQFDIATLPAAKADPLLLRQVWANLISNAIKYSSKVTAPEIKISGRENGDEIVYEIRDNGVGFDMAYSNKLFGVFQRLHRSDEFPGTGVGLAIVHRIVTRHGGRVWAQGGVNQGAEFSFSLPLNGAPFSEASTAHGHD